MIEKKWVKWEEKKMVKNYDESIVIENYKQKIIEIFAKNI